jgi:hypothetical protein
MLDTPKKLEIKAGWNWTLERFQDVYTERDSRARLRESGLASAPSASKAHTPAPWESYRDDRFRVALGPIGRKWARPLLIEGPDVSDGVVNSWVGDFAPSFRLPDRDAKKRPVA